MRFILSSFSLKFFICHKAVAFRWGKIQKGGRSPRFGRPGKRGYPGGEGRAKGPFPLGGSLVSFCPHRKKPGGPGPGRPRTPPPAFGEKAIPSPLHRRPFSLIIASSKKQAAARQKGSDLIKSLKKIVPALVALAVLIAVFWGVYTHFSPKAQEGEKHITISIVDDTGAQTDYTLDTDAEYLLEALDAVADIDGEEGEYGYTLYTVNGVTADFNTGNAYWAIYVNGEYGSYGLSQQPVNDGDAFSIVYETYAG